MTATMLKGDASRTITLVLADGFDYSGATVEVVYQGERFRFSGCKAGDVLELRFTAEQTAAMALGAFPLEVRIVGPDGGRTTVENSGVKIEVTDDPHAVSGGKAILLDVRGGLAGVDGLPDGYTLKDLRRKVNEIISKLGGSIAALLLAFAVCGAGVRVDTAPLEDVPNTSRVVTNAVLDASGLVTDDTLDATLAELEAEIDAVSKAHAMAQADTVRGELSEAKHAIEEDVESARQVAEAAQASAEAAAAKADEAQSAAEAAQEEVAAVRTVMAGEDFRITITNYDSKVHAAVISMEARYSDGTTQTWATVWNETNGLARAKRETLAEVKSNYFDKATADGRYKAWGNYDSQTGEDAPEGFVQVSAPGGLVIGADAGWKNYLSASGGSYWVWRGNGSVSTSQETGTLSILDADGNAALTVVKGDKTLESATAASIAATSDGVSDIVTLVYVVDSAEAPTVEYSAELKPAAWFAQTDDGFPGTVEWTSEAADGGTKWTATVTVPANGRGFFRATYWRGAESYVNYNKPMAVETIIVGGVRYAVGTAEINGVTVLSLTK